MARGDVEVHVLQDPLRAGEVILEGDVIEVDGAVFHLRGDHAALLVRLALGLGVGDGGALAEHLHDPAGAGHGPAHHHEHHGHHHQRHHDLGDIGEVGQQLAGLQSPGIDHLAAEPHDGDDGAVDDEHHHGHIDDHHAEGLLGGILQIQVALGKLFPLMVLTDEGLDHPDTGQILLDHQVQGVGLFLQGAEKRTCLAQNQGHCYDQQRQRHQKDIAELVADGNGEKQG